MQRPLSPDTVCVRRKTALRLPALLLLASTALLVVGSDAGGQPTTQPPKKPADVPTFKLRWEIETKKNPDNPIVLFDLDGQLVVLTGRNKIEAQAFNARTGKLGYELPQAPDITASNYHRTKLDKGKFVFQSGTSFDKELVQWDALYGKATRIPIPQVSPGLITTEMSSNGRYIAAGGRKATKSKTPESPFRVIDQKTNKTLVSFDWENGTAHFTPNASRVLVHEANGRFRWFKLPSGAADGEWKFDQDPNLYRSFRILDMSADGGVILFRGQAPKKDHGLHLLDGKNGEVLFSFPRINLNEDVGFLSPDGKSVLVLRSDGFGGHGVELQDARGTPLATLTPQRTKQGYFLPQIDVSWDARALVLYNPETSKLSVYEFPGAASSVSLRPPSRDPNAKPRTPIPGDAAVAKAEEGVRQVLKAEYARKLPAEKKALAQKLIVLADETTDDPAARFVMLRDARDFAIELNDPALAVQAIEAVAKVYQIDGPVQLLDALEKILAASNTANVLRVVAEVAGPAADEASAGDEFDEAVQFAQLALNATRKAKLGPSALEEADYRLAQAKKAKDSFAALRPVVEKLKTNPDDREANTSLGKYRCFVQGRWEDGLKHFSKGSNETLRGIAELDLKTPRTGTPEVKIADTWWEYAQSAPADELWGVQTRTRYWYGRCIPGLTGLSKARAESRLVFTQAGVEYRPGLVCEFSAKLPAVLKGKKARIDPIIDFSGGEFSDGSKQTDLTVKWTGSLVPPLAGRYTLSATTGDPVRVRVDGKVVIDTVSTKSSKKEGQVVLGERPTSIVVEFFAPNTDRHKLKLHWTVPGTADEETIPAENLFHDKKAAAVLGK